MSHSEWHGSGIVFLSFYSRAFPAFRIAVLCCLLCRCQRVATGEKRMRADFVKVSLHAWHTVPRPLFSKDYSFFWSWHSYVTPTSHVTNVACTRTVGETKTTCTKDVSRYRQETRSSWCGEVNIIIGGCTCGGVCVHSIFSHASRVIP